MINIDFQMLNLILGRTIYWTVFDLSEEGLETSNLSCQLQVQFIINLQIYY